MGYSPWGCKESDMKLSTELIALHAGNTSPESSWATALFLGAGGLLVWGQVSGRSLGMIYTYCFVKSYLDIKDDNSLAEKIL